MSNLRTAFAEFLPLLTAAIAAHPATNASETKIPTVERVTTDLTALIDALDPPVVEVPEMTPEQIAVAIDELNVDISGAINDAREAGLSDEQIASAISERFTPEPEVIPPNDKPEDGAAEAGPAVTTVKATHDTGS